MKTIADMFAAEEAISDSTLPASIRAEMSRVVGRAFDGGETGVSAWDEPRSLVTRYGSDRLQRQFANLAASIDLEAIRAEGGAA